MRDYGGDMHFICQEWPNLLCVWAAYRKTKLQRVTE